MNVTDTDLTLSPAKKPRVNKAKANAEAATNETKTPKPESAAAAAKARTRKPKIITTPAEPPALAPAAARTETKRSLLIAFLRQPEGATLPQLSERFGWLPHTVRAALTGLRKAGFKVERATAPDGASLYCLRSDA